MSADPREPAISPAIPPSDDPAAEAGCADFEATLLLLDGELDGDALVSATTHADGCATCGPLVKNWSRVQAPVLAMYDSLAEGAKPELAALTDRVMAGLGPDPSARAVVIPEPSWFARTLGGLQAWLALGAVTAALLLILPPLLNDTATTVAATDPVVTPPVAAPLVPAPVAPPVVAHAEDPGDVGSIDEEPANEALGVVVRHLEFEGGDGLVFRAAESDTTVIWVNEYGGT